MNRKTKYVKPVNSGFDERQMLYLLNGKLCIDFEADKKLARRVWKKRRSRILAAWIDFLPGSRPYAFWKFEAHEPRRAIQGVSFYDRRPDILPQARTFAFGLPCGTDFSDPEPVLFESEADYLQRRGLLTEHEKTLPIEALRKNSCYSFRRSDLDKIEAVLQRLSG